MILIHRFTLYFLILRLYIVTISIIVFEFGCTYFLNFESTVPGSAWPILDGRSVFDLIIKSIIYFLLRFYRCGLVSSWCIIYDPRLLLFILLPLPFLLIFDLIFSHTFKFIDGGTFGTTVLIAHTTLLLTISCFGLWCRLSPIFLV